MVGDQVNDDLDAALFGFGNQVVEIGKGSKQGVDVLVVGDVVTRVLLGRFEKRGTPDRVNTQFLKSIKPGNDAGDVAHAITIAVGKGARVDLVDDC